VKAYIQ
jgi:hypothetical protein